MRNLISFITKYSFFFLFLIFEVFAFYLLFQNNHFQRASFLHSTNSISGGIYTQYSEWTDYLNLKEVNIELSKENQLLRDHQLQSFQPLFGENVLIKDTIFKRRYHYKRAKVVNNSINKQNNYVTLNIGSLNGIESGMGVIGPQGVVGVIKNVSKNYASVLSVLHRSSKISAKLKKTQYFGSMQWDGIDYRKAKLYDIPNHVNLSLGDTIITSGFSATFPEGIAIATIESFEKPEGENFYDIRLDLINDFKQLTHVYVVKNNKLLEQKELEKTTEKDD